MKTQKIWLNKITFPFIVIAFITIVLLLCTSSVKAANNTTKVVLNKEGQNVKVSISPAEGASIASFQIGLKIQASKASDIKNVTFDWANIENAKLKKESYDKETGILNLYVVTDIEQNTGNNISVGTIKIETNKNTQVSVTPMENKTVASSIAHQDTAVVAKATDKVTIAATGNSGNEGGNAGDNNQGGSDSGNHGGNNQGSGNQGGNNSGSEGNSGSQSGDKKPSNNGGSNSGTSSNGNGSGSNGNGSNSGNSTDKKDDDEKDKDENKNEETNNEANTENSNQIENSSNQVENVATGALPQTGENDNFIVIWIFMALVVLVGVLLAFGYKTMNKKNTFKL